MKQDVLSQDFSYKLVFLLFLYYMYSNCHPWKYRSININCRNNMNHDWFIIILLVLINMCRIDCKKSIELKFLFINVNIFKIILQSFQNHKILQYCFHFYIILFKKLIKFFPLVFLSHSLHCFDNFFNNCAKTQKQILELKLKKW